MLKFKGHLDYLSNAERKMKVFSIHAVFVEWNINLPKNHRLISHLKFISAIQISNAKPIEVLRFPN